MTKSQNKFLYIERILYICAIQNNKKMTQLNRIRRNKRVIEAIETHLMSIEPEKEIRLIRHEGYQYHTVFFRDDSELEVEVEYDGLDPKIIYVKIPGGEKTAYKPVF